MTFSASTTAEDVVAGLDLTGKTIVVTGSSAGLGAETARVLAKERLVGMGHIGVGDHDIGRQPLARSQFDPGCAARLDQDPADRGVAAHLIALAIDEADHRLHQSAHAAHGEMHAMGPFQVPDQTVISGSGQRVTADQ